MTSQSEVKVQPQIVANLWSKQLEVGDVIIGIQLVDSRYGPLNCYTVKRPGPPKATNKQVKAAVEYLKGIVPDEEVRAALDAALGAES